jgi:hypothetical protein
VFNEALWAKWAPIIKAAFIAVIAGDIGSVLGLPFSNIRTYPVEGNKKTHVLRLLSGQP